MSRDVQSSWHSTSNLNPSIARLLSNSSPHQMMIINIITVIAMLIWKEWWVGWCPCQFPSIHCPTGNLIAATEASLIFIIIIILYHISSFYSILRESVFCIIHILIALLTKLVKKVAQLLDPLGHIFAKTNADQSLQVSKACVQRKKMR